jgi:tetratricopeptide (TPR) repeat protein
VGRDELISAVWGRVDASDTVVAQTLLRARKALDDTGNQQGMIRTVPRFGYQWVAPVQEVALSSEGDGLGHDQPVADAWEEVAPEAVATELNPIVAPDAVIDESATPSSMVSRSQSMAAQGAGRISRLGWLLLAALLVVALGLGVRYWRAGNEHQPVLADDAVLVMPFAVVPTDSEHAWVRLGAMDYMAARLRSSGINVLPSEQAMRLSAAVEGESPASARQELFALSGARWIVLPQMQSEGKVWRVSLRLLNAGEEHPIEARGDSVLAAAAAAADACLRRLGGRGAAEPPPGPLLERLHRIDAEILAGRLPEARRLIRSSPPEERRDPRFLLREAKLEFRATHFDAAGELFQAALDDAPTTDVDTRVGALVGLGTVERVRNHFDAAEQRFTQSMALQESLPPDRVNSRMLGLSYQGRGIVRVQRGDIDGGVQDMGQARVWLQRSGDLITLAVVGHNLGKAEVLRGNYLQALNEFDHSIETFARFRVYDYLSTTLQEKAEAQMVLARPADAWRTIARALEQLPKLENDSLAQDTLATAASIQIALGRLHDADVTLAKLRARGMAEAEPRMLELQLRLHLTRGEIADARRLARNGPPATGASSSLMLSAVQAALRSRDIPLAKRWLAGAARTDEPQDRQAISQALARALVARATDARTDALQQAQQAADLLKDRPSPELEIRVGIVQATLLLDTRRYAEASAIMGGLEKYAESDYRVAWAMSALYQALGDPRAETAARGRIRVLAGERDFALEPVL